jgi:two-component system, chemotaxis family, protein-glutamate methylesterase/glutaminase
MSKLRVALVDDRPEPLQRLTWRLRNDPRFQLVGAFSDASQALKEWGRLKPDVAMVRWSLGGAGARYLVRQINCGWATPIVVLTERGLEEVEPEARDAGAVGGFRVTSGDDYWGPLAANLLAMSRVQVLRRGPRGPAGALTAGGYSLLGIACSTGGPPALLQVLRELGPDFPLPVVILQHLGADFAEGFREWLARETGTDVQWATSFEEPSPGTVYLAPPSRHLTISGKRFCLLPCASQPGPCPSATLFFSSVAAEYAAEAIGVVLTGMGDDGAEGLLRMRQSGAYTLAQDQASSAVYGMPAAAVALHAAVEQVALDAIGKRLSEIVLQGRQRYGQGTHL